MTHPGFLDQPFIKVPNPHPEESIDFRVGEIVYSNPKSSEWNRLLQILSFNIWLYSGVFWPMSNLYKTHIPSKLMTEGLSDPYLEYSMMIIDTMGFSIFAYPAAMCGYGYLLMKTASAAMNPFVSKLQYNKTKDLLFVTTTGDLGKEEETVIEMANLEHVTPSVKSSNIGYSFMDKGGFMVLKDLSTGNEFYGKLFYESIF